MAVTPQTQFEVRQLSGATNGLPILVAATATAGTVIHTATSTSGELERVTLYAFNAHSSDLKLSIELGGVTIPKDVVEITITTEAGMVKVIENVVLSGGVVVRAFCGTANQVSVTGHVVRMSA
jgi:hypothetical protein|tara:strand:+ start:5077 stop:5445 length:369 start_codon:yes stop_codon:yes gene_type:complete